MHEAPCEGITWCWIYVCVCVCDWIENCWVENYDDKLMWDDWNDMLGIVGDWVTWNYIMNVVYVEK
jgi:hypothetical protein